MEDEQASSGIGMHIIKDFLIVPVNTELNDNTVMLLQKEILKKTQAASIKGVLIDVSAVHILDSFTFSILADTARMVAMLGAKAIFVGFQAGVASTLIDLDIDFSDINTALTMEDGLEKLRAHTGHLEQWDETEVQAVESILSNAVEKNEGNENTSL